MEESLKNKKIVITGGSSGIGQSISKKLLDEGAGVFSLDIQIPTTGHPPNGSPEGPHFVHRYWDLSDPQTDISLQGREILNSWAVPDVLILNAGRGIHEKIINGHMDEWEKIFHLNFWGHCKILRSLLPKMNEEKEFYDVVFISSVSAQTVYEGGGIYCASKAALNAIAETLRLELRPKIRVTTLLPGVVDTPFFKNIFQGTQTPESIGWGALSADDVAGAVLFSLKQPSHVALNTIIIRPRNQPM